MMGLMIRAVLISWALLAAHNAAAQAPYVLSSRAMTAWPSATVSVNLAATSFTIPADFIGIDFEQWDLVTLGQFTPANTSLISLLQLLGTSGQLSYTGASGDLVTPPALTAQIATDLATFTSTLGNGWSVYYSLDAFCNCVSTAVTHAGYLQSALGSKVTFSIGTEETDGSNFTATTYATLWNSYYPTLHAAYPTAKFGCCDLGNYAHGITQIGLMTGAPGNLSLMTQHYFGFGPYVLNIVPPTQYGALLSKVIPDDISLFSVNAQWAIANSIPLRNTQTNSVSGGGQPGISDRMISVAWFLDYAIVLAREGTAGLNLHSGIPQAQGGYTSTGNYAYSPLVLGINGNWKPGPVFYGQYLFSKIVGQQIVASSVSGNANVFGIATKGASGNANIIIVNNDVMGSASARVEQSSAWTTANVLIVRALDGCLGTNLTVGGQSIGDSGAWSGAPFSISKGQSITLGPCEAALVQVQP